MADLGQLAHHQLAESVVLLRTWQFLDEDVVVDAGEVDQGAVQGQVVVLLHEHAQEVLLGQPLPLLVLLALPLHVRSSGCLNVA